MKVRHMFVSNSSSSSFVIAVGVVEDIDLIPETRGLKLKTIGEIRESSSWSDIEIQGNTGSEYVHVESFADGVSTSIVGLPADAVIAYIDICVDAEEDEDGTIEQDFEEIIEGREEAFNVFEEEIGLKAGSVSYTYGSGRNG